MKGIGEWARLVIKIESELGEFRELNDRTFAPIDSALFGGADKDSEIFRNL